MGRFFFLLFIFIVTKLEQDSIVLQEWVETKPEFRWCSASCGSGQLVGGGEAQNSFLRCEKCIFFHTKTQASI